MAAFGFDPATLAVLQTMYATYAISVTSPGPNVLLMVRAAAAEPRYVNVAALGMGLASATGLWLIATCLGLTMLIHECRSALFVIQCLGIAFFAYLGGSLLIGGRPARAESPAGTLPAAKSPWASYLTGLLFNLSNAGTALFFVTLFGPVAARIQSGPAFAAVSASIFILSCSWQLLLSCLFFLKGKRSRFDLNHRVVRSAFGLCFLAVTVRMIFNLLRQ